MESLSGVKLPDLKHLDTGTSNHDLAQYYLAAILEELQLQRTQRDAEKEPAPRKTATRP